MSMNAVHPMQTRLNENSVCPRPPLTIAKQRDVVATDHNNNRVVDERGHSIPNVALQEALPGVDDAFRRQTECLVRLNRLERLSEADLPSDNDEVRLAVEECLCVCSSL